jgi:hypothetical protein
LVAWLLRDESGRGVDAALLATGSALLIIPTVNMIGAHPVATFEQLARALR